VQPALRSALAVGAGFLLIAALAFGTGSALAAAGVYPPATEPITDGALLLLESAYVAVYAIAGCWLAAVLAPDRPMRHALILGALGLAFNLAMAPATRGLRPDAVIVANLALVMPYAWIGGRLRELQLSRGGPAAA
jgi:hypothetical protein